MHHSFTDPVPEPTFPSTPASTMRIMAPHEKAVLCQVKKVRYSAGFLFDESLSSVALVKKDRPAGYVGKWATPGGKIEPGELPIDAMRREFKEEAGVDVQDWGLVAVSIRPGYEGYIYFAVDSQKCFECRSVETEPIGIWSINAIRNGALANHTPDLLFLLEMALLRAEGKSGSFTCIEFEQAHVAPGETAVLPEAA